MLGGLHGQAGQAASPTHEGKPSRLAWTLDTDPTTIGSLHCTPLSMTSPRVLTVPSHLRGLAFVAGDLRVRILYRTPTESGYASTAPIGNRSRAGSFATSARFNVSAIQGSSVTAFPDASRR